MSKQLSKYTQTRLEKALVTVGDMALKRRAKRIVEELELRDGDKILDLGCGNGYYLSLLNRLRLNISLIGIDNDKMALFDARRFIGDDKVVLTLGDATNLPFKASSFNKIICSEVIEHVEDDKKVLQEIHRVLKKGGIMVLSTCNINYPFFWDPINWLLQHIFKTHVKKGFWSGIWNQHLRMYKVWDVENLINDAGFHVSLSECLTSWCLPFNHYLVNFIARLFYSNKLPKGLAKEMNKFQTNKQSLPINFIFKLINAFDKLNDLLPTRSGVSIFVKAKRI